MSLGIVQKNGKFVVTKNGEQVILPKSDGQAIVTEFESKEDAQKYLSILEHLTKRRVKTHS